MKARKAVVLLSGGLDSAVAATIAKCERYDLYALTFQYGQRNERELESAKKVADALRVKEHKLVPVPLDAFGQSALTDAKIDVPKNRSKKEIGHGVPVTYVPGRNTVFVALGLAYAESVGADALFIGAHALDYSGYPDCRPEYFEKWNELSKIATKQALDGAPTKIVAPLVQWTKAKIVETGRDLQAPMRHTWSCYESGPRPCGSCDACQIRQEAFDRAGIPDPALAAQKT